MAMSQTRSSVPGSSTLMLSDRSVEVWELGTGDRVLFVLPGYLQTPETWISWLEKIPEGWKVVLIGMPGSIVKPNRGEPEWRQEQFLELLTVLREKYSPTEEAWLGYSLGGRLLLYLAGIAESGIQNILLMSPDGLAPSISERVFLYHRWGQKPLKWLINHPQKASRIAGFLRKSGLMSQSGYHFSMRQLRDIESLATGFEVVRLYTQAQPIKSRLRKIDRLRNPQVWVIWGEDDKVRPISQSRSLWKYFAQVHLIAVPGGHTWPKSRPDLLTDWLEAALGGGEVGRE